MNFLLALLIFVLIHFAFKKYIWGLLVHYVFKRPISDISKSFSMLLIYLASGALYIHYSYGVEYSNFFVLSGVSLAILGFALQKILLDAFSGILLSLDPPFRLLDNVKIGDERGKVLNIGWRATTVLSENNNIVFLPNGNVATAKVINYSLPSSMGRDRFEFSVDHSVPYEVVKAAIMQGVKKPIACGQIVGTPEPFLLHEKMVNYFNGTICLYSLNYYFDVSVVPIYIANHEVSKAAIVALKNAGIPLAILSPEEKEAAFRVASERAKVSGAKTEPVKEGPLLDSEIMIVDASWKLLTPVATEFAQIFYQNLFEAYPHLRELFRTDAAEQQKKLIAMLGVIVRGAKDIEALLPIVQELGVRHVAYGVKDEHYAMVGASLIKAFDDVLGDQFTEEIKAVWLKVYGLLSNAMLRVPAPAEA
ncbi:mechanosensitive ion channel [Herbaspirillum sp. RTI4]|uniref:globin domain-containing protein n=1 Tax=Herbaspirillum sp. RTI4 TaxID=3048640 RepID=UPI002AB4C057|nr:globin domain-containing protein [Herbaspirillum sp. RTI4]MDY7579958.1 mechanosensitive ion channel [Herbaspirillum sp. RTI4]MEA9982898.1 mechanosensitive ion channel [Herbaspirillum sp. RTI4]